MVVFTYHIWYTCSVVDVYPACVCVCVCVHVYVCMCVCVCVRCLPIDVFTATQSSNHCMDVIAANALIIPSDRGKRGGVGIEYKGAQ